MKNRNKISGSKQESRNNDWDDINDYTNGEPFYEGESYKKLGTKETFNSWLEDIENNVPTPEEREKLKNDLEADVENISDNLKEIEVSKNNLDIFYSKNKMSSKDINKFRNSALTTKRLTHELSKLRTKNVSEDSPAFLMLKKDLDDAREYINSYPNGHIEASNIKLIDTTEQKIRDDAEFVFSTAFKLVDPTDPNSMMSSDIELAHEYGDGIGRNKMNCLWLSERIMAGAMFDVSSIVADTDLWNNEDFLKIIGCKNTEGSFESSLSHELRRRLDVRINQHCADSLDDDAKKKFKLLQLGDPHGFSYNYLVAMSAAEAEKSNAPNAFLNEEIVTRSDEFKEATAAAKNIEEIDRAKEDAGFSLMTAHDMYITVMTDKDREAFNMDAGPKFNDRDSLLRSTKMYRDDPYMNERVKKMDANVATMLSELHKKFNDDNPFGIF